MQVLLLDPPIAPGTQPTKGARVADETPPSWAVRIETKLDMVITAKDDHEKRLRALEANRWPLPAVTVIIALAALLVAIFGD